jgi:2-polyprenyl-3-methyl-5-hydroxy-6-metoxy-1,4-benzoquinol methylase
VLDVGCGTGPSCIYAGLKGARRVVGVDILPGALDYARSRLHREYPELANTIEFRLTNGDLKEIGFGKFDVIISQNSFEHYSYPENIIAKFTEFLSKDGILAIAFAPLWKSPYGGLSLSDKIYLGSSTASRKYHHAGTEATYSERTRSKI